MGRDLTIGERVAWYRRRRGMSQEVLAGLVSRTVDWLSKVENNRIDLDRLSVVKSLADALDVTVGDLLAEPTLLEWTRDSGRRTTPGLREALMDYRQLTPLLAGSLEREAPDLTWVRQEVGRAWDDYQASRYGRLTRRLTPLLARAQLAANGTEGSEQSAAWSLVALAHQVAGAVLTKTGEADLAWIAADRGLVAAQRAGDPAIVASLFRAVTHALLANGRFQAAVQLTRDAASYLQPLLGRPTPEVLSVYGMLFLAGAMASSRAEDRATTREFLAEADEAAARLGADGNYLWTAFGPTNVSIHRVATAMELGDVQVAIDLGPRVDASSLPVERRVRHALELAHAFSAWNRFDEALAVLLEAEQQAPEQVRHHYLSRQLVLAWIRRPGRPDYRVTQLASRLRVG